MSWLIKDYVIGWNCICRQYFANVCHIWPPLYSTHIIYYIFFFFSKNTFVFRIWITPSSNCHFEFFICISDKWMNSNHSTSGSQIYIHMQAAKIYTYYSYTCIHIHTCNILIYLCIGNVHPSSTCTCKRVCTKKTHFGMSTRKPDEQTKQIYQMSIFKFWLKYDMLL